MSTAVLEREISAAIEGVFTVSPPDKLQEQVLALGRGLNVADDDEDAQVDQEWARRVDAKMNAWMQRLDDIERQFQERIANFYTHCLAVVPNVSEFNNELAQLRLERAWIGVAEYFRAARPSELLTLDVAPLFVDVASRTAWWTVGQKDDGILLRDVVDVSLSGDGEFSPKSVDLLRDVFVRAICDGSAPIPGFEFQEQTDGIAVWHRISPELEEARARQEANAFVIEVEDANRLWQNVPRAAAQLELAGYGSLGKWAPEGVPVLADLIRSAGVSDQGLFQQIALPLMTRAFESIKKKDADELQIVAKAFSALIEFLRTSTKA
jgi:hypothetical protein